MRRIRNSSVLAFATLFVCACSKAPESSKSSAVPATKRTLAVIPKGTTHMFWKAVEQGARDAGNELGVEIRWKGPLKEDDRAQQIALVQQFAAEKISGLALAPLDHTALFEPVKAARALGIPVVIYDSGLDGTPGVDFASFIATDNKHGGALAAINLAELLGGNGEVVLLRYVVGSASTAEREAGFLEGIAKMPAMKVIVDNRYAGASSGEAKTAALNMLESLKKAQGIFCPNESSTMGMLLALRQAGLAGKVRFVGFDCSPPLLEALKNGEIDALVLQDPRKMGYLAVKTLNAVLDGKRVEATIDTGVAVVTKKNLADPAIAKLLE